MIARLSSRAWLRSATTVVLQAVSVALPSVALGAAIAYIAR